MRRWLAVWVTVALLAATGCSGDSPDPAGSPAGTAAAPAPATPAPATPAPAAPAPAAPAPRPLPNQWGIDRITITEGRDEAGYGFVMNWDIPVSSQDVAVGGPWAQVSLHLADPGLQAELTVSAAPPGAAEVTWGPGRAEVQAKLDAGPASISVTRSGGDTFTLRLRQVEPPVVGMSLAGQPHVTYTYYGFDSFPTVPPGPQELQVTFSKPADRSSVEAALVRSLAGAGGGFDDPGEPPPLDFDWRDDQHLTVRFTVAQDARRPPMFVFRLSGAHDREGARFGDGLALAFYPGSWHQVWRLIPGQDPVRVGRTHRWCGRVSPDGRYIACSEGTYRMGDGGLTAAWLADMAGHRRYLGGCSDYVTWVADGLMVHGYQEDCARLIPREALDDPDPAAAARPLPLPEGRRVWDLQPEPGGSRVAAWLTRESPDLWPPRLDLYVIDPAGDWQVEDIARARLSDSYAQAEDVAFGPDGALYWMELEKSGYAATGALWRLTRDGREQVHPGPLHPTPMGWAGDEIFLAWPPALLDPQTGAVRPLPPADGYRVFWVSADGQWLAQRGRLYRRSDLRPVGSWDGFALGFDAAGAFYYAVPETGGGTG